MTERNINFKELVTGLLAGLTLVAACGVAFAWITACVRVGWILAELWLGVR